jgi:hypothetical protein
MKRALCTVFMIAGLLLLYDEARSEPLRVGENLRHENVLLPYGPPTKAN